MRSITLRTATAACAVLLLAPVIAQAHPGHGASDGLTGGLAHPFTGLDHVLAMLAVGYLAALQGGRVRWMLPVAFAAAMTAGFAVGTFGIHTAAIEPLVAASVLVLGLAIFAAARMPASAGAGLVAGFGVIHGLAHGAEAGAAPWTFGVGMLVAAIALLGAGMGIARFARGALARRHRIAGAAVAACGAVLLLA